MRTIKKTKINGCLFSSKFKIIHVFSFFFFSFYCLPIFRNVKNDKRNIQDAINGNGTSISMTGNPVSGCQKTFLGFPGRLTLFCKKAHPHPSPCIFLSIIHYFSRRCGNAVPRKKLADEWFWAGRGRARPEVVSGLNLSFAYSFHSYNTPEV